MKKSKIYLSIAVICVAVVGVSMTSNNLLGKTNEQSVINSAQEQKTVPNTNEKIINVVSAGEADTIIYRNLDELEQGAQIIVEATISGKQQIENYVQDGEILETYGVTDVKVNKVYKGNLNVGDVIPVAEPGYFDEKGNYISFEGYKIMDENGRYLLFMNTSKSGKHVLLGLFQGKFDLNINEEQKNLTQSRLTEEEFLRADYVGDYAMQFNKLKAEVHKKYSSEEAS